jgi:hypothetical protein
MEEINVKKFGWRVSINPDTKRTKFSKCINKKWVNCGLRVNTNRVWISYDGMFINSHKIKYENDPKLVTDVETFIKEKYPPQEFTQKTHFQQMEELGKRENERYEQNKKLDYNEYQFE